MSQNIFSANERQNQDDGIFDDDEVYALIQDLRDWDTIHHTGIYPSAYEGRPRQWLSEELVRRMKIDDGTGEDDEDQPGLACVPATAASDPNADARDAYHQRLLYRTWNLRPIDDELKALHRVILFAILKHCWSSDHCAVGENLLAAECWTSVRTLQRALPILVKYGYIRIKVNPNHASTYYILDKTLLPPYKGGRKK